MSQPFLVRFPITSVEQPAVTAIDGNSVFLKTLTVNNLSNATVHVYLGIVRGTATMAQGDFLLYRYDITGYGYVALSNVLIPDGHQLRAYAANDTSLSLVGSGVVGV